jgi:hypothetical protein
MSPATVLSLGLALVPGAQAQGADGTREVGFVATPAALVTGR